MSGRWVEVVPWDRQGNNNLTNTAYVLSFCRRYRIERPKRLRGADDATVEYSGTAPSQYSEGTSWKAGPREGRAFFFQGRGGARRVKRGEGFSRRRAEENFTSVS